MAQTCSTCKGTRVVKHESWKRWWAENHLRPLDQQDPLPTEKSETACPNCLGTGHPLTEGERVLRTQVLQFIAISAQGAQ